MKNIFISLLTISLLIACNDTRTHLNQIVERGELRVLSRYGLTSYYTNDTELAGFEYELAQRFAERLNVKLKIIVPESLGQLWKMLEQDQADMAAAGLTITPSRQQRLLFGPVYHEVTQQIVYRNGNRRPRDITQLDRGQLEVVGNSSHVEQLVLLQQEVPTLNWIENYDLDNSELLKLVQLEMIDYTIADSNEMAANQSLFPELRVAFDLSDPQPLAWVMRQSEDQSLHKEVVAFFEEIEASGYLDQLIEKYYGYIHRFDYVDTRAIHRRILTHLPGYQDWFVQAAKEYNFDWRLLAAMAYQESHWNPDAVSSTGVRGLMMLTQATAEEMGVNDRVDPQQSIHAGTAYLASMKSRLPDRITEPDRTWLGLAAYNIGMGHLEDGRVITEMNGGNPDLWSDVRENLPLLAKQKWFTQTRFGYARGGEPVRYVENIRRYYDILLYQQITNQTPSPQMGSPEGPSHSLPAAL